MSEERKEHESGAENEVKNEVAEKRSIAESNDEARAIKRRHTEGQTDKCVGSEIPSHGFKIPVHETFSTKKLHRKLTSNQVDNEPSTFEKELVRMSKLDGKGNAEGEASQEWGRPVLPVIDPAEYDIVFQQLDADETIIDGYSAARFFGVTNEGHSVLCKVVGFRHYFYAPVPKGFGPGDLGEFRRYMEANYQGIVDVKIAKKESIWGFNNNVKLPFFKVVVDNARHIGRVRAGFERGEVQFKGLFQPAGQMTFDNVQYLLRLMIDCHIVGMGWLTAPRGKYELVGAAERESTCQIEIKVSYKDLISHAAEGKWQKTAPLRVMSFDIECSGRKGIFPEPEHDAVIQIANVVSRVGEKVPFVRNVFTVKKCSRIVGSDTFCFDSEREMLMAWRQFVVQVDPDVMIGYNICNFDFPYLLNRAIALGEEKFAYFGRLTRSRQEVKDAVFSSRAYGTRESKTVNIEGRMQLDLFQFIQREYKLRSYTLNAVSSHFLGEQKEDVPHSIITQLQNGTPETRRRLAVYCLKDSYLPLRLMEKLMCLVNYTEMARVTGVPFSFLLSRGQQIKVISQLFRKCLELDIVIPNMKSENVNEEYEGATVISPARGYYDVPIATLDFASLYPSIMMAHNVCYTTLVDRATIDRLQLKENVDYEVSPKGDCFVTAARRLGILPTILKELLSARKKAKKAMKAEKDPFKKQVLNGRQLALKISANSVYGFTGATIGKLPCLAISSSVTAWGRKMIAKTQETVLQKYNIKNGYKYDSLIVYGDTDSVMVRFGYPDMETCFRLGQEAADYVTTKFKAPIKLEFEKVYFPYLLINKKRYAGLWWTQLDHFDKMDTKGIESVRRDNCRLVQNVVTRVLELILEDRDVKSAQEFVRRTIADLLQNRVDLSQLVITKQLSRQDYAAKQPHVELADRMRKRDPGSAPTVGDRVAYVIIKTAGDRNWEKSEDPLYVLENSLPIDTKYYLENQLSKPLIRIFEPILGEHKARDLLTGSHTRTVRVASAKSGGLMRFTRRSNTCRSCKAPIPASQMLCANCRPLSAQFYARDLANMNALQAKFNKLWTQCQRCQGSLHQQVLCTNRDCPIFYMRKKVQKDVLTQAGELRNWDAIQW